MDLSEDTWDEDDDRWVLEVDWIIIVFPELGPGVRSIVPYVEPVDREFKAACLGYGVAFGTYNNRTQWSINVETKIADVEQPIETARRVLWSLNVPATTFIRYKEREIPICDA